MPSFFVPAPGDLTASKSPPTFFASKAKKMLMPGDQPGSARVSPGERAEEGGGGGWAQLELTDA